MENRRRFIEQCKILVQLEHKNIVPVLGWCDSRRLRAIVTEWVDGENIEAWLATCNPPWKQRVQAILGIAAGICYLHEEWPQVGRGAKELEKSVDVVEWVKSNYPDNVENVIDKRMKKTVEIVSEAAEVLEFGLTCIDVSNSHQPSWDRICGLLADISSTAISSASADHGTSRIERGSRDRKHVRHRGVE
ncbi:UNVERIFIED_CONTAM: putative L-type lectin-domain containing receptor kinase I.1 [Sesamum radiatum]|uniref:L-type lectin-domain containing receptor kinase I.1 n=1 Tax=Sesamum radiatum TaxID=300843 RepID=A0AAW2T196_SESRA